MYTILTIHHVHDFFLFPFGFLLTSLIIYIDLHVIVSISGLCLLFTFFVTQLGIKTSDHIRHRADVKVATVWTANTPFQAHLAAHDDPTLQPVQHRIIG